MHETRIVVLNEAQAVYIPAEVAYDGIGSEFGIEPEGDVIRIRSVRQSLAHAAAKFAEFSSEFMSEGRGEHEQAQGIEKWSGSESTTSFVRFPMCSRLGISVCLWSKDY